MVTYTQTDTNIYLSSTSCAERQRYR